MTPTLSWTPQSFTFNGTPAPMIGGEFHYFRVPAQDWKRRLTLLKESGANVVATYIPWIIHEPEEGKLLFDDVPQRNLSRFLSLCTELELSVIVRPGPYSYSELCRDGLPFWLYENYPQTLAHGPKGEYPKEFVNASYLHPVFLQKARAYYRAVNERLRPFLAKNGGCISMVQVDNEMGGIHIWRGFLDCNEEAMGFGREDGHYVRFLKEKYSTIEALNAHYETDFSSFCHLRPFQNTPKDSTVGGKRFACDYLKFYQHTLEIYTQILCSWLEEDGIDANYCTNAGSPSMISLLRRLPEQNKAHHFLLGADHYYTLSPSMGTCMTPEKAVKYLSSLDMQEALGMPPSVLEMQSGSSCAYPPILPENLLGFYMTHVAFGMKGSNYYVFTGGPNFENSGANVEIYDYHAPVSASGEIRPLYHVQKQRNEFSLANHRLLSLPRVFDLQFGFDWDAATECATGPWSRYSTYSFQFAKLSSSLQLTLALGGRLYKSVEIGGALDKSKPLIVVSDQRMAREKQKNLIRFVKEGGKLILGPILPSLDEDFLPCTLLRDYLGTQEEPLPNEGSQTLYGGTKLYETKQRFTYPAFEGSVLCCDDATKKPTVIHKTMENGEVILLGTVFHYSQDYQMKLIDLCLDTMNAPRSVTTDCRQGMLTLFTDGKEALLFFINNLPGSITQSVRVRIGEKECSLKDVPIPALSTLSVHLGEE